MRFLKRWFYYFKVLMKFLVCWPIFLFIKQDENVWLIIERGEDARDNGYYFYRFLREKKIKAFYVISKKSVDYKKIDKNDILHTLSFKHIIYIKKAYLIISTHTPPNYGIGVERANLFISKFFRFKHKNVRINHGIIYNYFPELFNNQNIHLWLCGSKIDNEYILNNRETNKEIVKYTGLARFDNLFGKNPKKQVLVMPTWRMKLSDYSKEEFQKSEYYNSWNGLINDSELIKILRKNHYTLVFYPHHEVQKRFINFFTPSDEVIVIAKREEYDVQKLLIESEILITDYSSVFFDFAYMNKPVIYYHFDYKQFFKNHYNEGYFEYTTMGFGPVFNKISDVANEISNHLNKSLGTELYNKRSDIFFPLKDRNNCQRILDEVSKL